MIRILWITNIKLPAVCEAIGESSPVLGGWLVSSAMLIKEKVTLTIATVYKGNDIWEKTIDGITYILVPFHKKRFTTYDPSLEEYWKCVQNLVHPDVVHIHGTEFPFGLAYINACGKQNCLVSLQGLTCELYENYTKGIKLSEMIKTFSPLELYLKNGLYTAKLAMKQRMKIERSTILAAKNIAGRTFWDRCVIEKINPSAQYHYIGEILRPSFYESSWEYSKCHPHSIFLSQAGYTIKGLHTFLRGLTIIKSRYPDVEVRIAGEDITKPSSIKQKICQSGYGRLISSLIRKYNLQDNVSFIGSLTETEMKTEYLRANVFVCPSSIENSPNSLGEAQLLGVPCVASFVGGIPSMIDDGVTGFLYRYEDYFVMASYIMNVFSGKVDTITMSNAQRKTASKRHDKHFVIDSYMNSYNSIIGTK